LSTNDSGAGLQTKPYSAKDTGVERGQDRIPELIGVTFEDSNSSGTDEAGYSENGGASERSVKDVRWITHAKL